MEELSINLHIHTTYSDGRGSHREIADAALNTELDVIIITDHNVLVNGMDRYYRKDGRQLLMLIGEEIHDQTRQPPKNHLLAIGHNREMAPFARDPQNLIDQINKNGGLAILAHPNEDALPLFGEGNFSWVSWDIHGFQGIELWNGLSEIKTVIGNPLQAIFYAFFPECIGRGPKPETLKKWDELTTAGEKIVAVGGSDAHRLPVHMGPFQKTIFPYEFHFRAVNTHLLTPTKLSGDLTMDRRMILDALRLGHCFIGYDLPASTKGFRFTAQGKEVNSIAGDCIQLNGGITLQAKMPEKCECLLIRNGQIIGQWFNREVCTYFASEPGVYRIECYLQFLGRRRGWIFSNPIYIQQ